MNTQEFVEHAKSNLDQIDNELGALEAKVNGCAERADEWAANQARKLRADVETARSEVTKIAKQFEGDLSAHLDDSKAHAERHWEALKAAVKAYRDHVAANL